MARKPGPTEGSDSGDVLYFDGQCPICNREIDTLRRLADARLEFQDIHQVDDSALSRQALFSQLHLRRSDGTWATGLEANVIAWQHTRWRPLVQVLTWPLFNRIAQVGYSVWLRWYQWQRNKRSQQAGPVQPR
jgi:predicted DCC family thiol-disulfide oxidoreductase YuxK